MSIEPKSRALLAKSKNLASHNMAMIGMGTWPDLNEKRLAMGHVERAHREVEKLIDEAVTAGDACPEGQTLSAALLDTADVLMDRKAAPHMRAAKIESLRTSNRDRRAELAEIHRSGGAHVSEKLATFAKKARQAAKFAAKVARDPFKYYAIAEKIVNKDIVRAMQANGVNMFDRLTLAQTDDVVEAVMKTVPRTKFADIIKGFEFGARFFGVVAAGLIVTTIIFETVADLGKWGPSFAKAGFAGVAGFAIGAAVATATVQAALTSAMTTLFAAAGITAEAVPLSVVLLGAGIVVGVGLAVASLFNAVVDWIFGLRDIPSSMRARMSAPMSAPLFGQMAARMAADMS